MLIIFWIYTETDNMTIILVQHMRNIAYKPLEYSYIWRTGRARGLALPCTRNGRYAGASNPLYRYMDIPREPQTAMNSALWGRW